VIISGEQRNEPSIGNFLNQVEEVSASQGIVFVVE
jgi:hypothetical protein